MPQRPYALAFVVLVLGATRGCTSLRKAMLPRFDAETVVAGVVPAGDQAAAWRAYEQVLQCEVLDPCLAAMRPGNEDARMATCGASFQRLQALPVPATLPAAVRKNAEFVRQYWLGETGAWSTDGVDWSMLTGDLDTCTSDSITARLDRLYGLVGEGAGPASCASLGGPAVR